LIQNLDKLKIHGYVIGKQKKNNFVDKNHTNYILRFCIFVKINLS